MKYKIIFFLLFTCSFSEIFSQDIDLQTYVLDSVLIGNLTSKKRQKAYHIIVLPDSLESSASLSHLIENHTAIFIKEYGRGMLSSISLRGTGTAHTQIVWNGIAINSILNGQTDLNTFAPAGFDEIYLKKGGSSVSFGSGAIGGLLVFNDHVSFKPQLSIQNQTKLGSFKTGLEHLKVIKANEKFYTKFNFEIQKSKNDYPFVGYKLKNDNGAYQNLDYGFIGGWHLRAKHQIYFKSKISRTDRETSRTVFMPQNARLLMDNKRFLIGWQYQSRYFKSRTQIAYLDENFQYYFNKEATRHSQSSGQTYLIKNNLNFQISKHHNLLIGNEFTHQKGLGDHIDMHQRDNYALFAIWSQNWSKINTQVKLRQDFNPAVKIPLVSAVEISYQWQQKHHFRFNTSKNFRLPTFNDLYWQPGGNTGLKPEESYSSEIGYDFVTKKLNLHLTGFLINSHNLIKWTPGAQLWQPQNFETVTYKGLEISGEKKIKSYSKIILSDEFHLTYQQAINHKTEKYLAFTPQLMGLNILSFKYKKFGFQYRFRYQGRIYTTSTNSKYLPAYQLHHVSLAYYFNRHINILINLNNILNTYYENVPTRPQPGRNYELIFNFKI